MEPFFVALIALVVIALAVYSWYASAKRKQALRLWAAGKGLTFQDEKQKGWDSQYGFECFRQGSDRYAHNIMTGPWGGRPIRCFDYHYTTTSTDSKGNSETTNHEFSAIILDSPIPLRPLRIRPENLLDKLKAAIGFEDINFESAQFSRQFYVTSPDRKWAYDVLHARAMEFLLAMPRFKIQFGAGCVIVYRDSTFSTDDFDSAARVAAGLLDQMPPYLVQQQTQNVTQPQI